MLSIHDDIVETHNLKEKIFIMSVQHFFAKTFKLKTNEMIFSIEVRPVFRPQGCMYAVRAIDRQVGKPIGIWRGAVVCGLWTRAGGSKKHVL